MTTKSLFSLVLGVALFLPCGGLAAEPAVAPQTLTLPVALAGKPDALKCVVARGPVVPVTTLGFSPDSKTLAVGGYQEVVLWDIENGALLKRLPVQGNVGAVMFLADGRLVVGEGMPYGSGAVRILDVTTGKQLHAFEEPQDVVYALAVSPDGKFLAAGGADNLARVWNLAEKKLVATLKEHIDWILAVSFSRDGKFLVTGSADRNGRVWDCETWEPTAKLKDNDTVHGATFSADGRSVLLAVGGATARGLIVRRTDNIRSRSPISLSGAVPLDVVCAGKAGRYYVPCNDGVTRIIESTRTVFSLAGHTDWVYCAALSPDESKVATGSADGTVKLWNPTNGKLFATLAQLAPKADQWLLLTVEGPFTASAADVVQWQAGTSEVDKDVTDGFNSVEKVKEALAKAGQTPPPTTTITTKRTTPAPSKKAPTPPAKKSNAK